MDERYELREKIGQGGIGSVHRAYDHNLGRHVAIKRILTSEDDPSLKEEATKQLMVEAGALASLQHPNIVIVQDVGADEEGPYVVMELINGKTLDEIIEDGLITWNDCKQVAMQSLEALIAAQELNMIHSDLKPPNIMLTWLPSGTFQVKILDFGLAVLIHNQSQEEIENMESQFGSIFFMPPEQFERKILDARSDLYSLGCCFYQALTGNYPFMGETGEEVMASHLNHKVVPLEDICDDVPIWACQWIMWLINRNPGDRPESAREALANFVQNDVQSTPVVSQSGTGVKIPQPISSSALRKVSILTSSVKPVALSATQAAGLLPSDTLGDESASTEESTGNSILSKLPGNYVKITAAAAVLLLIGILSLMVKRRNDRIRTEDTYYHILAMAAEDDVKEIQVSGADLGILLDFIRNSAPNADLKDAYRALVVAKADDGTNVGKTIAGFATSAGLPGAVRQNLFEKVLGKRNDEAVVPTLIRFSANAANPEEAITAINAISKMAGDEHVESLIGVLTSTAHPQVRNKVESLLKTVISRSKNSDDLTQLLSASAVQNAEKESGPALKRLWEFFKPKGQAQTQTKPQAQTQTKPQAQTSKQSAPVNISKPSSKPDARSDDEFKPMVLALSGDDDAKKIEAINALGNSGNPYAHAILMGCANDINNAHLKLEVLKATLQLNSNPVMVNEGDQSRQRWVQITWAAKTPQEEKLLINAISEIQKDWVPSILQRMMQYSKNDSTKEVAKKALDAR